MRTQRILGICGSLGALCAVILLAATVGAAQYNTPRGGPYQDGNPVAYNSTAMIRGAQAALKNRNYYGGTVNGFMTQETRAALQSFQSDNGLEATGQLDQPTASALGLVRVGQPGVGRPDMGQPGVGQPGMGRPDMGQPGIVDPRIADILYRQSQSLLSHYESTLGVRVGDIRSGLTSNRELTEGDLNLLLDVDGFNKAAYWYEQAVHSAPDSDASDVALRILSRGAGRIQDDLQNADTDQIFGQQWNNIQSDLNRMGGAQNQSGDYNAPGDVQRTLPPPFKLPGNGAFFKLSRGLGTISLVGYRRWS